MLFLFLWNLIVRNILDLFWNILESLAEDIRNKWDTYKYHVHFYNESHGVIWQFDGLIKQVFVVCLTIVILIVVNGSRSHTLPLEYVWHQQHWKYSYCIETQVTLDYLSPVISGNSSLVIKKKLFLHCQLPLGLSLYRCGSEYTISNKKLQLNNYIHTSF